jgi:hypothetical protein
MGFSLWIFSLSRPTSILSNLSLMLELLKLFSLLESSSCVKVVLTVLFFSDCLRVSLTDRISVIILRLVLKVRFLMELSSVLMFLHSAITCLILAMAWLFLV